MTISDNLLYVYQESGQPVRLVLGNYFTRNNFTISHTTEFERYFVSRYDIETKDTVIVGEILDTVQEQFKSNEQSELSTVSDDGCFVKPIESVVPEI